MIMIPAQKRQLYGGYGGSTYQESFGLMSRLERYDEYGCTAGETSLLLGSHIDVFGPMADQDESKTDTSIANEAGAGGSSSMDVDIVQDVRDDAGWLQLGIGGSSNQQTMPRARLIELDLLPGGGGDGSRHQVIRSFPPPAFHVPDEFGDSVRPVSNITTTTSYGSTLPYHHQEINWAFRTVPRNITAVASTTPSSYSLSPPGLCLTRSFQLHAGVDHVAGPSLGGFRIIDPPRRPISGVWFMLQASQNQDGRMTVRLLMKYLVIKLTLDSESEIEITCRGQQLLPFLTLQHVRDHIWRRSWSSTPHPHPPSDDAAAAASAYVTSLPDSSTTDHVMVLHYARPRNAAA